MTSDRLGLPIAVLFAIAALLIVIAIDQSNQSSGGAGVSFALTEAPADEECLVAETTTDYGVKFETCASGGGFGVLAAGSGTATADAHPDTLTFTSGNTNLTIEATDTDDSVTFDLGAGLAGRSLSFNGDALDADAETYSHSCDWTILDATEDITAVCTPHNDIAVTVTRIFCITETDGASVTIDARVRANRFTPGTSIDNTMACNSSGYTDSSISSPSISAGGSIAITIATLTTDGENLGVVVDFTKDD